MTLIMYIEAITTVWIYLGGEGNKTTTQTGREEKAPPIYSKPKTLGGEGN